MFNSLKKLFFQTSKDAILIFFQVILTKLKNFDALKFQIQYDYDNDDGLTKWNFAESIMVNFFLVLIFI